jgi:hypothetical protein
MNLGEIQPKISVLASTQALPILHVASIYTAVREKHGPRENITYTSTLLVS